MTQHMNRRDAERALDCIDASDDPRNLPAGLDGIGNAILAVHDTLAEIRDRLPERVEARAAPLDPDVTAANIAALKHELETPTRGHGECCDPAPADEPQHDPDAVTERPAEDIAYRAHRAAVQHLQNLTEARWAEEDGTDIDWAELGTAGPYDGCDDCVVREVATIVIAELEAAGAIRFLDPDDERAES